jgi:hypothetical protein
MVQRWSRLRTASLLPSYFCRLLVHCLLQQAEVLQVSPRAAMRELLQAKFSYARGHHRDKCLQGRRLESWFSQPEHMENFLDALASSSWIDTENPEASAFMTRLVAFGGPMFKVFDAGEMEVVQRWLRSLTESKAATMPGPESSLRQTGRLSTSSQETCPRLRCSGSSVTEMSLRSLFHGLVNEDEHVHLVEPSRKFVEKVLGRTGRWSRWRGRASRHEDEYNEHDYYTRIDGLYRQAVASYSPLHGAPWLSRDEYRWLLVQLAPLFLVDGCWLQKIGEIAPAYPRVVAGLLEILADEIGDGEPMHNHANVFRKLLHDEAVVLPEIETQAFVRSSLFIDAAFELPVYLLAISLHPRAYLPELLGLNLAIEMSGLGGFYMRLIDELRYYGFDPTIISLHLSIDNLSSGHAAIARDIIPSFMADVRAGQGEDAMHQAWRRLWTGYRSLGQLSSRLLRGLAWAYCKTYGPSRLSAFAKRTSMRWPTVRRRLQP